MSFLRQEINLKLISIHYYNYHYYTQIQKQKKYFYVMQIAYTNEFVKVRNLNDIVREFP